MLSDNLMKCILLLLFYLTTFPQLCIVAGIYHVFIYMQFYQAAGTSLLSDTESSFLPAVNCSHHTLYFKNRHHPDLHHQLPSDALAHLLEDSGSHLVVAVEDDVELLPPLHLLQQRLGVLGVGGQLPDLQPDVVPGRGLDQLLQPDQTCTQPRTSPR